MSENKKMELTFDNINLKCEGYSIENIISLLKTLDKRLVVESDKTTEQQKKVLKNNDFEEIDTRELGKTVRMPKTTNNFRCPSCGQALMTFYQPSSGESILLVREITSSNTAIYKANVVSLPKIEDVDNFISVYKELLDLLGDKVVLVENSEDMCGCPCCLEEKPISDWINAYNNPLDIFEISDMCNICGKEGSTIVTQTGEYISCENNCMKKLNKLIVD